VTDLALIGAPTSAGAFAPGQEQAPQALRATGLLPGALDLGDTALRGGHRALVLGGDCTIELGVVAGAQAAGHDRLGLVYFDLHADINTPQTIPGGTLDWMGMAHLLGRPGAHPDLPGPLLGPEDVVLLGVDDEQLTDGERTALIELALHTVPCHEVRREPRAAAERALALAGHERLLVHFDVDVVDFVDLPLSENTGHNIGLPFAAARTVLETLMADPRVQTLTVTEHNPQHDPEDGAASAALAAALASALTP
jgi:arginase